MKIISTALYLFVILFYSCETRTGKWAEIKKTKEVYPGDSITFYDFKVLDFVERRWINNAYKDYKYKTYCQRKLEFQFDASVPKVRQWLSQDSLSIAKMLHSYLKEEGIAHFVAQSLSYDRLHIYFYLEDDASPFEAYERIRLPAAMSISADPEWGTYALFEEKK
jgi:hypothetical protein